jgi:hypothetical protein
VYLPAQAHQQASASQLAAAYHSYQPTGGATPAFYQPESGTPNTTNARY